MSRYDGILSVLRRMNGRRFTFVEYMQGQPFNCDVCKGPGKNGYILRDQNEEQIAVGKTCFREYFSIYPNESTEQSD